MGKRNASTEEKELAKFMVYNFPSDINVGGCKEILKEINKNFSVNYKIEESGKLNKDEIGRTSYVIGGKIIVDKKIEIPFNFERKRGERTHFSSVIFYPQDMGDEIDYHKGNVKLMGKFRKSIDQFFEGLK